MDTATVKNNTLQFIDEIETVDLLGKIRDIEEEIFELNCGFWELNYGDDKEVVRLINEVVSEIDFNQWDYITDLGFYWCGMLPLEPFEELGRHEEDILNLIVYYHIKVNDDGTVGFKNNSKSPLYRFFLKHRDGYGGNISYAINKVIRKVSKIVLETFRKEQFIDRKATFTPAGWCNSCKCYYFSDNGLCPDCREELDYSTL